MHLTNYSVNKHNAAFVANTNPDDDSSGSKWSFSALLKKLQENKIDTFEIKKKIYDIIIKTILSAENLIYN